MSFLGGVLGGIVGFVTGGPAGAVLGAAKGFGIGARPMMMPSRGLVPFTGSPVRFGEEEPSTPGMPMPMGMPCPPGTACNGPSMGSMCIGACVPYGMQSVPSGMGMVGLSGRCPLPAPRGYHWNQKTYCTLRQGVVPKCTKVIKNRHLNPANGRAARRAVRRIAATHRLLKRIEKSIRRIKGVRSAKIPRTRAAGGSREVAIVQ